MKKEIRLFFSHRLEGNMAFYAGKGKERAMENRYRFFKERGFPLDQAVFLQQTHSDRVLIIQKDNAGRGSQKHKDALPDADALLTNMRNIPLCVQVADCVPILLWDKEKGVIGAIHSGWRGTLKNIVGITIKKMCATFTTKPENIHAWIGPAVGGCCFSIDGRICLPVQENGFVGLSSDKTHWDIAKACRGQLITSGALSENIFLSGECTVCHPQKYFSYKREGEDAGRMLGGIVLTS